MAHIDNSEDVMDSRDIIARIKELERDDGRDEEEQEELDALHALQEECACTDWYDGVALIRDSYFEEYAEEVANDIGAIDSRAIWPLTYIDWEQAARDLQMDYTSVDFDGVTYWVR